MKKIFFSLLFLFSQYAFCLNQTSLNIFGQQYVVSEVDGMYYVNKQVESKTLQLNTDGMKWSKSCDEIIALIKRTSEGLAHCQKGDISPRFVSGCKSLSRGVHQLIWGSPLIPDKSMGIARWSLKNDTSTGPSENTLIEKVASLMNIKKSRILISDGGLNTIDNVQWKYVSLKDNHDFDLLKNFYAYADEYSTNVEPYSGGIKTFDNLSRCSLLMHEAELDADVEYKIEAPGAISEGVQNKLEDLFTAFREVKIESQGNMIHKLLVVGAYIGYSFQNDLDYRDSNIVKTILAIFSSLFDNEFHLKKSIDYSSYRKAMNILPVEITVSGKLRAIVSE